MQISAHRNEEEDSLKDYFKELSDKVIANKTTV